MTNEEAIELLIQEKIPMILDGKPNEYLAVAHIKAIEALEENTKLQAEIEQLNWKLSSTETQRDLKGYDAKRNADSTIPTQTLFAERVNKLKKTPLNVSSSPKAGKTAIMINTNTKQIGDVNFKKAFKAFSVCFSVSKSWFINEISKDSKGTR